MINHFTFEENRPQKYDVHIFLRIHHIDIRIALLQQQQKDVFAIVSICANLKLNTCMSNFGNEHTPKNKRFHVSLL